MAKTIEEKIGIIMTEAIMTAQDRKKWRNIVYDTPAFLEAELSDDSSSSRSSEICKCSSFQLIDSKSDVPEK